MAPETPNSSGEAMLESYYEARGTFEDLYVDDNVIRQPPEVNKTEKETNIPRKPTKKSSTDDISGSVKKPIDSTKKPVEPKTDTNNQRVTRAKAALLNPPASPLAPVDDILADDTPATIAAEQKKEQSQYVNPKGQKRKPGTLQADINADRPKFGTVNEGWEEKGEFKYPDHYYQNALNIAEKSFMKVKAPRNFKLPEDLANDDFAAMGLPSTAPSSPTLEAIGNIKRAREDDDTSIADEAGGAKKRARVTGESMKPAKDTAVTPTPTRRSSRVTKKTYSEALTEPTSDSSTKKVSTSSGRPRVILKVSKSPTSTTIDEPALQKQTTIPSTMKSTKKTTFVPPIKKTTTPATKKTATAATPKTPARFTPVNAADSSDATTQATTTSVTKSGSHIKTEADDDADADAVDETPSKQKKTQILTVEASFRGVPSLHGYSINKPTNASEDTPWQCGDINCASGFTWISDKDHFTKRKTISQYFGRNKAETRLIPDNVWHVFCRKHYQRSRYEHNKDITGGQNPHRGACLFVLDTLEDQVTRLELWRPQALFKVQLTKNANVRAETYRGHLLELGNDQAQALAAMPPPKVTVRKSGKTADPTPENDFPTQLLHHFKRRLDGENKTYADIRQILTWLRSEVNNDNTHVLCPLEFLINKPNRGEIVNDPQWNYQAWEAHRAGNTFDINTVYIPGAALQSAQADGTGHDSDDEDSDVRSDVAVLGTYGTKVNIETSNASRGRSGAQLKTEDNAGDSKSTVTPKRKPASDDGDDETVSIKRPRI